jgi:general secretion pathway protein L
MFGILERGWTWLVEGLADAAVWGLDRLGRREAYRVEVGDGGAAVKSAKGADLGRLIDAEGGSRFEPPDLARRLAGAAVDVLIPPAWLFRRELDPVAAQSAPYLDAFVRHHIDRITPWRSADVHYRIDHAPLPGDPTRLAVEVGVVPKRFLAGVVAALEALRPGHLRIVARSGSEAKLFAIPLGTGVAHRTARIRRGVAVALWVVILGVPAAIGWIAWQTSAVQAEIEDADRIIEGRKAVLAAAARHDRAGTDAEDALRRLRASRLRAVDLIDALSAALPDDSYLTEFTLEPGKLRISGVSTNTPRLVPALESSGRFADAAFFEATTRVEAGTGDRFHIEMRLVEPAKTGVP